ncbi:MAG TPA: F0F1 ATP synthase subunit A [Microbacteriaceae bacterium]|nr:F0F1 ATP synthase subunit A [Microbacteriaceae bacterium]
MTSLVFGLKAPFTTADDAIDTGGPVFHGPEIGEFFPEAVLFIGTPFEMNRIMILRVIITLLVMFILWLAASRMRVVPTRFQGMVEYVLGVPRKMTWDLLGEHDGRRFLPLITTVFLLVLSFNFMGIIPPANIALTSVIGVPLLLAVVSYVVFIYAGIKRHGWKFFWNSLVPKGVPGFVVPIVAIIELVSTFILRPVTLTLRLLMNMMVGHLLLVLFFVATSFFLFEMEGGWKLLGAGTLAFGFAWSAFEILVSILQAYVFAVLTTLYIQLALADDH